MSVKHVERSYARQTWQGMKSPRLGKCGQGFEDKDGTREVLRLALDQGLQKAASPVATGTWVCL